MIEGPGQYRLPDKNFVSLKNKLWQDFLLFCG